MIPSLCAHKSREKLYSHQSKQYQLHFAKNERSRSGGTYSFHYIYIYHGKKKSPWNREFVIVPACVTMGPFQGVCAFRPFGNTSWKAGCPCCSPFFIYFLLFHVANSKNPRHFSLSKTQKKEKRAERVKLHRRSSTELYYVYPRNLVEHRLLAHNVSHLSRSHDSVI